MSAKYKPSDYEVFRRRCVELKETGWNRIAEAKKPRMKIESLYISMN